MGKSGGHENFFHYILDNEDDPYIRQAVAFHEDANEEILVKAVGDIDYMVRLYAIHNPNSTVRVLEAAMVLAEQHPKAAQIKESARAILSDIKRPVEQIPIVNTIDELRELKSTHAFFKGEEYVRHKNEFDGSEGGFVAASAEVHEGSYIEYSALVGPGAKVQSDVQILKYATVEKDAEIGEHVIIGNRSYIGDAAKIGNGTKISLRGTIGSDTVIGDNTTIEQDTVVSSNVNIGDNVDISVHVEVGKYTVIGNNTQIEHRTYIGSNAKIGYNVKIGDNVKIGEGAIIKNNAKIGNKAEIRIGETISEGEKVISDRAEEQILDKMYSGKFDEAVETAHRLINSTLEGNDAVVFRGYHFTYEAARDKFISEAMEKGKGLEPLGLYMSLSVSETIAQRFAKSDNFGVVFKVRLDDIPYKLVALDSSDEHPIFAFEAELRVKQIPRENIIGVYTFPK